MLKRLMTFLLAVLMVLTLCAPALADELSPDVPGATEAAGDPADLSQDTDSTGEPDDTNGP